MKELKGNLFDMAMEPEVDAICITTNGITNHDGLAMMGAGTAGKAAQLWPEVRQVLGKWLLKYGNVPSIMGMLDKENNYSKPSKVKLDNKEYKCLIWSFPTKDDFRHNAKVELIKQSSEYMAGYANQLDLKKILLACPGAGKFTGRLDWKTDVKPSIQDILDDRFIITSLEGFDQ